MLTQFPIRPTDFHTALLAAGLPVVGVAGSGPTCRIDFAEGATEEQQAQARQMAQAFDWTEPTPAQLKRRAARAALRDADDRTLIAVRFGLRVIYQSLTETRAAFNQIRAQLIAAGLPLTVPALINRTWDQALAAVEQQIDAEVP